MYVGWYKEDKLNTREGATDTELLYSGYRYKDKVTGANHYYSMRKQDTNAENKCVPKGLIHDIINELRGA